MKYIVKEMQGAQSLREGMVVEAKTLRWAKCLAAKLQAFRGTVMRVEDMDGTILALKVNRKWENVNPDTKRT
ncbi:MAG: hypothetical protein WC455_24240 [Dehalococcoidia bacterium]